MTTDTSKSCCGPGYASPEEAMQAPREKLLYTVALYIGTGIQKPDYLATIDADPESPTYSQVISRLEMPGIGDELHHMGWNACSSCHHDASKERRYLILPGVRSSNLHIVDCATDPRKPRLHKVITGDEIKATTNLSAPHTVHCLGSDIIISMLDAAVSFFLSLPHPHGMPPQRRPCCGKRGPAPHSHVGTAHLR
jgi:selenium-binding protein 1